MKNKRQCKILEESAITLVALVVTIVVLLILAGITITYVFGENSIFKQASEAKLQTEIAKYQEMLETAKGPIFIEGLGTFDVDKYFEYIEKQGIIEDREADVIDNGNGTYDVTTKPGYIFLVTLMPNKEKPTDVQIEYIGQAGKIAPMIKELEVSATQTSITGKATVVRLGKGTVEYYYKLSSADDTAYQQITNVNEETGATQSTGITAGESYRIKVVAKNDGGEVELSKEITATRVPVERISLNKTTETIEEGKTVTLIATVEPEDSTNKNVTWESSNTGIATVSNTGVVTGKAVGTATITVKTTDGSNKSATCIITVKKPTVADIVGETQTSNKVTQDGNGNKITIPGGFKVVPNGGTDNSKVEYTYNGDGTPAVQDGIVIEDEEGNQFVWIPVGSIKNKDGSTTTITLGRYTFDATNGTPTLQQNSDNYTTGIIIKDYFRELTSDSGGTAAKNLGNFVTKTKANGGYYLGRYEASKGTDNKVKSQYDKVAWVDITQLNAATEARRMYNSDYVESDLVNSYSWDTAIIFIQKYSGNTNYANKTSVNTGKLNTGKAEDKVCNIRDMTSNCAEWSTEHYTNTTSPCIRRGGNYNSSNITTSSRVCYATTSSETLISFRPLLYLK